MRRMVDFSSLWLNTMRCLHQGHTDLNSEESKENHYVLFKLRINYTSQVKVMLAMLVCSSVQHVKGGM
jgi:hypothetical protein